MKFKQTIIDMKKWIVLVLIAIISYWGINNFKAITSFVNTIYGVLFPFILGGIIAFVLNIPMSFIEKKFNNNDESKNKYFRIISIILSLLLFIVIILFVSLLLIPELIENIELLIENIPGLFEKAENFVIKLLDKYPVIQLEIKNFFTNYGNMSDVITNILNYVLNGAIGFISDIVSGVVTIFTGIIFAIYMLCQKEYLIRIAKKIVYVLFNKKYANKCIEIGIMANKIFSKFISGQCVEAIILGCIIFLVSSLFRFPYALIISVLTSITALIPIFGGLIAMVVGTVLIGITNPLQALFFIIVFLVIQQIEGNFIYPKVVGKSVGLSPMWTLLAISVGGSLFGVVGMLVGLPLASIIYVIIKDFVNTKLNAKKIIID